MLYFRRKSIRNFKNVLIFHTLKYFKRITILFDLLLSTSVFPPTKQSIDLFPFLRLLLSRVTLFAPSVPLKKKQEKGWQSGEKRGGGGRRNAYKSLNVSKMLDANSVVAGISMSMSICICGWATGWDGK